MSDSESVEHPVYELERYRQFIRDAAAFVSLIAGRKLKPADAELLTDDQLKKLALLIDARVKDLKGKLP